MEGNNPCYVILVPGANSRTFSEDRIEAERRGIQTYELTLPSFTGHPIDDRIAHFNLTADIIDHAIKIIRSKEPFAQIGAIGRNNGGGQLAWALGRWNIIEAAVLVGAIPEISLYRKESNAPSAVKFRHSLSNSQEFERIDNLQLLDIVSSSKKWMNIKCLMQFGHNDPYIDETAISAINALAQQFQVEWLDDEHAMVSAKAINQRWNFLEYAFTK